MDDMFIIDTKPTVANDVDVPRYRVGRKSTELTKTEEEEVHKTRGPQYFNPCYNCGETTHAIRDCKMNVNLIAVEWNKGLLMISKFYEQRHFQKGTARYHENEKNTDSYSHIKPGTVSSKLRTIMGLSTRDLPPYVYRLRKHGYPKAWLKHTMVKPSGINLYDAQGNEVADPDAEEGEILEEEDKVRYDLSKLIEFPGFNAPMPDDVLDDYEKMAAPPYCKEQSLAFMIKDLKEKSITEYHLKKEKTNASNKKAPDAVVTETEMEVEPLNDNFDPNRTVSSDFIPPLPEEKYLKPPLPSESVTPNHSDSDVESSINVSQDSLSTPTSKPLSVKSRDSLGRVLSSTEGTPVLRSSSGHSRLPPPENFSKDICDVINFENLPESTGKFERMRGLLKKVKEVLGSQRQSI